MHNHYYRMLEQASGSWMPRQHSPDTSDVEGARECRALIFRQFGIAIAKGFFEHSRRARGRSNR